MDHKVLLSTFIYIHIVYKKNEDLAFNKLSINSKRTQPQYHFPLRSGLSIHPLLDPVQIMNNLIIMTYNFIQLKTNKRTDYYIKTRLDLKLKDG